MIILSLLCALAGIAGAIIPGIPGPAVAWLALLLAHLSGSAALSPALLWATAGVALAITVLDYVVPVWGTRRLGGTKAGSWGSTLGLVAGMFLLPAFGPLGLGGVVLGPFAGAWLGEKLMGNKENALRSAWGSFLGLLAGTLIKLLFGIAVAVLLVASLVG